MTNAVFTTKEGSSYDDRPWEYYHFPKTYLNFVEQTVGDLIVYYEPRRTSTDHASRGGRKSYFATALVTHIEEDQQRSGHFYARVKDYLRFDHAVPFKKNAHYFEGGLQKSDGSTNKGNFGRAVRLVPHKEFELILSAGFSDSLQPDKFESAPSGLSEIQMELDRPMVQIVLNKPFRDKAFKLQIREAYDNRCAVTGLRLLNGGGRPEIEAAHIKPVEDRGPDAVQNGIALSRTAHWMFDRGLISVTDDMKILKSKSYPMGDAENLINRDGYLITPENGALRPHPAFLNYHRETIFKE
jgi:putative restriction endonuclease